MRGGEKRVRGRTCRVLTVQADLDEVGKRGGGVGHGKNLDIGIAAVIGGILDEVSIIKDRIKIAHYVTKKKKDKLLHDYKEMVLTSIHAKNHVVVSKHAKGCRNGLELRRKYSSAT